MQTEEVSNHSASQTPVQANSPIWRRRAVVTTSILLSMLGAGICLAPTVLTGTSVRNQLLNSAIGSEELTATADSATGGWFAPLMFKGVRIQDANSQFVWTVKEIQTSKGLLAFLTDPVHIGEIRFADSAVKIRLNDAGKWPLKQNPRPSNSELSFHIENGSLDISVPWRQIPIVELRKLDISGNIAPDANGQRMLNIDPIHVWDHEPLSEAHTQQNLALIAPVLSQSAELAGSASVWLDEVHIPLDLASRDGANFRAAGIEDSISFNVPIKGRAEIHSLEARLKENWTKQLTALIGQIRGTAVPTRIQVMKDSRIEFLISSEGITHEGMVFLLPELANDLTITSSGSVHLDETIDLMLALNLPKIVPAIVPTGRPLLALVSHITSMPLQLRVLGTVSEPKLQLPDGLSLLGSLSGQVAPAPQKEEAPALPSAVLDLVQKIGSQDREQAKNDLPGSILNLIRAVDEKAKEKQSERKSRRK
ncbi:MAG: hypothetical protein O2856_02820 [Planctomycetota bacterium]|nr:hypothetical protein [Planctomycetota bacterium]